MTTGLAARLGIGFPLLQAGMGGIAGPTLAAATAEAGAGGALGLYRTTPDTIADLIGQTRRLTSRPFGVNLIPELMDEASLCRQAAAVLQASDPSVYFTFFGLPNAAVCAMVKRAGRALLIMVGSIEAMASAQALGADAIVLQGTEAGGHLLGTQRLDALIRDALPRAAGVPLVAAGGIACGHRFHEIARLGIAGCLSGTLFVATTESRAHPRFKQRVLESCAHDTVITDLFDIGWRGRPHRVLRNTLTAHPGDRLPRAFIASVHMDGTRHPLPRYSAMVPTVQTKGRIDEMAMYAGESVSAISRAVPVGERVRSFIDEFHAATRSSGQPHAFGTTA